MGEVRDPELEQLRVRLGEMIQLVRTAMSTATSALLDPEHVNGDTMPATRTVPQALLDDLDDQASVVLARERVAGTELRSTIANVGICTDVELTAELARHVAEVARTRHAKQPLPAQLESVLRGMGNLVVNMLAAAREFRGVEGSWGDFERDMDELARLRQLLYLNLVSGEESVDARTAVDVTLVGLYYERCADQAVSMARHVALLSGGAPER